MWPDRDDFIRINKDNIREELKKNFEKRPYGDAEYGAKGSVDTKHSPYDVSSALKFWEKRFIWICQIRLPSGFPKSNQISKSLFSPPFHVLHYGPLEGSKNGEEVTS